jgi:5'-deoxynucleotidase YfbR-like HD superfamily hydrolase
MVHKEVSRENFQEHFGYVALYAILHDAAECVTGDVVRVFKYTTPELKQEIDRAEGILFANLVPEVRQLFNFFNNQTDHTVQKYVKDIVKVADFLSLLQFMRREAMRGNLEIYPYFGRMITDLEKTTVEMEGKAHIIQLGKTEGNPFKPADVYNAMLEEAKRVKHVCFRTDPTSIL